MQAAKLLKGKKVRAVWDSKNKKWWISVVDICSILCGREHDKARNYWKQLKHRLTEKGSPLVKTVHQFKLTAKDGKLRYTDVMDYKKIIQLIQILPCGTAKAKALKTWIGDIAANHCDLVSQLDIVEFKIPGTYELVEYKVEQEFNLKTHKL